MNSNTHNQSSNNSTLFNSPISIYTHIIPQITNPIYNPINVDFQRLILQYEQYFFCFDSTTNSPKIMNLKKTSNNNGLDHSYTPEEYLKVEARLTFAIGEEPQNNPVKYRSWHNRRRAYIQCSLIGTALDLYTNLHISHKQQWNSFVQFFEKNIFHLKKQLITHK